jgi:hypothetical protein
MRETRRDTLSRENGMVGEGAGRRASDSNARTRLTARVQDVDHRREVESQDPVGAANESQGSLIWI